MVNSPDSVLRSLDESAMAGDLAPAPPPKGGSKLYALRPLPGNSWQAAVASNYERYLHDHPKRRLSCVAFLIFSGVSFASEPIGANGYFAERLASSYAKAFEAHQRPCKTAAIHEVWIRRLPYMAYLVLVALPVDVYAHGYQFLLGETDHVLEGGFFFLPYMFLHFSLFALAVFAGVVRGCLPESAWPVYFGVLRGYLHVNERAYRMCCRRRLPLGRRLAEFALFLVTCRGVACAMGR